VVLRTPEEAAGRAARALELVGVPFTRGADRVAVPRTGTELRLSPLAGGTLLSFSGEADTAEQKLIEEIVLKHQR